MAKDFQFIVRVDGPRPDFRTVVSFLWSDLHNVDSDGDSHNPASRDWTHLYLQNREDESEVVEIVPEASEPLMLRVIASSRAFSLGVSYFLVRWSSGDIFEVGNAVPLDQQIVLAELEKSFDLISRMERAEASIWNASSLENPYPNLK